MHFLNYHNNDRLNLKWIYVAVRIRIGPPQRPLEKKTNVDGSFKLWKLVNRVQKMEFLQFPLLT